MTESFISPFSLGRHDWFLKWNVPKKPPKHLMFMPAKNEQRALHDLLQMECMTEKQLRTHYQITKKQFHRLIGWGLLVPHSLKRGDQELNLFSLGYRYNGGYFNPNIVLAYDVEDVLVRCIFTEFLHRLQEQFTTPIECIHFERRESTFHIMINGQRYDVLVSRKDISDLHYQLANRYTAEDRVFIICTNVEQRRLLDASQYQCKCRITDDARIYGNENLLLKLNI